MNILLSAIFFVASVIISIHELEHINHPKDALTCNVCIVDDNKVIIDIDDSCISRGFFYNFISNLETQLYTSHIKKTSNLSQAPPIFS